MYFHVNHMGSYDTYVLLATCGPDNKSCTVVQTSWCMYVNKLFKVDWEDGRTLKSLVGEIVSLDRSCAQTFQTDSKLLG